MIDIASLVILCQTALATGSRFIEEHKKKKLSDAERELLIAATQQGTFRILSVDQIPGSWVKAGGKDFLDTETSDPAFAAQYLEAFRNLCERGYIVHEGGVLFMLTGTGFKKARELDAR
jgi:hypothetical protein